MSESVEQAARVAGWRARAEREAAAILAESMPSETVYALGSYSQLVTLVAIGWLQGANFGAHDTLEHIDRAFGLEKAEL